MRIALVHDYLNEAGGAERVLRVLADMYPEAPIYTAFSVSGSTASKLFSDRKIITSWFQQIPGYQKLYSPLRFIIPLIWNSFNFSGYDLIITSASWYITKGLGRKWGVPEICYCHTPPRWLYGYETSINWKKWWIVRVYALIVGHFLRIYDFHQAQKVDVFIANSKNVADRIRKFYRKEAVVVYPPVQIPITNYQLPNKSQITNYKSQRDYYLMVTRIVGGKGIDLATETFEKNGLKLIIAGEAAGLAKSQMTNNKSQNIEFLGRVSEEEKFNLMAGARAFLALARDEDFGITPIEAQLAGTPVIAFNGGGYKESVINNKTGVLFDDYSVDGLNKAILKFNKLKWDKEVIRKNAERFSEKIFREKMSRIVAEATSNAI